MDDRELVASLPPRADGPLPPRPGFLPPFQMGSTFVGEIDDGGCKEALSIFGIPSGKPEAVGDAPAIRMAIHRLPDGRAAVIVNSFGDTSDAVADWVPFDVARGRSLLAQLKCRAGMEGLDVEGLAHAVSYLSWFGHEAPFIATFDVERMAVLELGKGCMAVTAKARFGPV